MEPTEDGSCIEIWGVASNGSASQFLALLLKAANDGRVRYQVASDVLRGQFHGAIWALADRYSQFGSELRLAAEDAGVEPTDCGPESGPESGPVLVRLSELFPARTEAAVVAACLAWEEEAWPLYRQTLNELSLPREIRQVVRSHCQLVREHRRALLGRQASVTVMPRPETSRPEMAWPACGAESA